MLQKEPLLARIGVGTAENGPSEIWETKQLPTHPWGQINIYGFLRCAGPLRRLRLVPEERAAPAVQELHAVVAERLVVLVKETNA